MRARLKCVFDCLLILIVLSQVFLSIKGIYYQADVLGQLITWLVPYQFAHNVSRVYVQNTTSYIILKYS